VKPEVTKAPAGKEKKNDFDDVFGDEEC